MTPGKGWYNLKQHLADHDNDYDGGHDDDHDYDHDMKPGKGWYNPGQHPATNILPWTQRSEASPSFLRIEAFKHSEEQSPDGTRLRCSQQFSCYLFCESFLIG